MCSTLRIHNLKIRIRHGIEYYQAQHKHSQVMFNFNDKAGIKTY